MLEQTDIDTVELCLNRGFIDITKWAREEGFTVPVVVSRSFFEEFSMRNGFNEDFLEFWLVMIKTQFESSHKHLDTIETVYKDDRPKDLVEKLNIGTDQEFIRVRYSSEKEPIERIQPVRLSKHSDKYLVLRIYGSIDETNADMIWSLVEQLDHSDKDLVLDFQLVPFFSDGGKSHGGMIKQFKRKQDCNQKLYIINVSSDIENELDKCGCAAFVRIINSLEDID